MSHGTAVPEAIPDVSSKSRDDGRARHHAAAAVGVARLMSDGTAVPELLLRVDRSHATTVERGTTLLLPSVSPVELMSDGTAVPERWLSVSSKSRDDGRARHHAAAAVGIAHRDNAR